MTIHFDITSAESMLRLGEALGKGISPSPFQWGALYRTAGAKSLLENGMRRRREIRKYLVSLAGQEGAPLPGVSRLSALREKAAAAAEAVAPSMGKWLPPGLAGEDSLICFSLLGNMSEDSDPPVMDALSALSMDGADLEERILRLSLTQLLKRYQNLERFYLKNYLPIRRHMNFIYTLWDIQVEGAVSLMTGAGGEPDGECLAPLKELLAAACRADRRELEALGKRFSGEVDRPAAGRYLYSLFEGDPRRVRSSLDKPTSPWILLRKGDDSPLGPEENFFLDRLDGLLS